MDDNNKKSNDNYDSDIQDESEGKSQSVKPLTEEEKRFQKFIKQISKAS